jgi:L-ascorbate metabolism protein UlaG (beta-lactamase superfamily)
MHGVDVADAYSFGQERAGGLYAFVGYVIEAGGVRVYHAGDTVPYDGMEGWLRPLAVDVALLPINGRNAEREAQNLVGNLDHEEAARLAAAIGCDVLVPMHYDMFAANLGYPDRLVEVVIRDRLDLAVTIPARGRPWVYTKAR